MGTVGMKFREIFRLVQGVLVLCYDCFFPVQLEPHGFFGRKYSNLLFPFLKKNSQENHRCKQTGGNPYDIAVCSKITVNELKIMAENDAQIYNDRIP